MFHYLRRCESMARFAHMGFKMYTYCSAALLCLWLEYCSGIEGIKRSAARWQSAYLRLLSCNHRRAPSSVAFITLKASSSTFFGVIRINLKHIFFVCVNFLTRFYGKQRVTYLTHPLTTVPPPPVHAASAPLLP